MKSQMKQVFDAVQIHLAVDSRILNLGMTEWILSSTFDLLASVEAVVAAAAHGVVKYVYYAVVDEMKTAGSYLHWTFAIDFEAP
jgi:hypothetical protein